MTQVVAGFGIGWLVVAADRIVTHVWNETGVVRARELAIESKLMLTESYPIVLTATGPGYANDVIREYIRGRTFTEETGAIVTAIDVWPHICRRHEADDGLAGRGLPLAGLTLFAGAVDSWARPCIATAIYPSTEIDMPAAPRWGGKLIPGGMGTGFVMTGVHNATWTVNFEKMTPEQGIEATRTVVNTVMQIERLRGDAGAVDVVLPPLDIVLVTRNGAEWIERANLTSASTPPR